MSAGAIDEAKLQEFMGRMVGYMTGGAVCLGIWLGDELGLYTALADDGPRTADELADATGCNPRLVREWLDGQVAAGLIDYEADGDRYTLGAEAALALADENSPAFTARGNEHSRVAVQGHGEDQGRVQRPTAGWRGATTTRACSRAPSGSSGPATGRSCRARGSPRSTGCRRSSRPARGRPTSAAGTARRWS